MGGGTTKKPTNNQNSYNQSVRGSTNVAWLSMGDWGKRESPYQSLVASRMSAVARECNAVCVLCTGDNFYEHGVAGMAPRNMVVEPNQGIIEEDQGPDPANPKVVAQLLGPSGAVLSSIVAGEESYYRGSAYTDAQRRWWLYDEAPPQHHHHQHNNNNNHHKYSRMRKWKADDQWLMTYHDVYRSRDKDKDLEYLRNMPFLLCLGNHDYRLPASPDMQVGFTYLDRSHLWLMPKRYFYYRLSPSTPGHDVAVVVIDTTMLCVRGDERKAHKRWIVETLRKCQDAKCIVVMGHFPIHSDGAHCGYDLNADSYNGEKEVSTNFDNGTTDDAFRNFKRMTHVSRPKTVKRWLIEACMNHNVDLYVNGHNHNLEYCAVKSGERVLHCVTTGAASKMYKPSGNHTCRQNIDATGEYRIARSEETFSKPLFAYGFVKHELQGDHLVHTYHYVYPKSTTWQSATLKTALVPKGKKPAAAVEEKPATTQ
jgi:Calcineurin-like phosphoesterase